MRTYFIGSAVDVVNSPLAILIYSNTNLMQTNLQEYTYSYFSEKYTMTRDEDDYLRADTTSHVPSKINHVVYYDSLNNPIGFTVLDQIIDIVRYRIKSIRLLLNISITYSTVTPLIQFDYTEHIIDTENKVAHDRMLSKGHNAVKVKELFNITYGKKLFTRSLLELQSSKDLIFRYSNNTSWKDNTETYNYTSTNKIYLRNFDENGNTILDIFNDFNGNRVAVVGYNYTNKFDFYKSNGDIIQLNIDELYQDNVEMFVDYPGGDSLKVASNQQYYLLGSNIIILQLNSTVKQYFFVFTNELLTLEPGQKVKLYQINSKFDGTTNKLVWKFCKNPFDKSIYAYSNQSNLSELVFKPRLFKKYLEEFDLYDNLYESQPIYCGEGFVAFLNYSEDTITGYTIYNYKYPNGYVIDSKYSTFNPISSKCIMYRDTINDDKDLRLLSFEFEKDSPQISDLGRYGSHRNLYKVNRSRKYNHKELYLTNLTLDGCLYIKSGLNLEIL